MPPLRGRKTQLVQADTVPTATQLLPASLVSRRPGVQKASNKPVALSVTSAPVPTTFAPISDGGQVACGLLQSITDLCTFSTHARARARARQRDRSPFFYPLPDDPAQPNDYMELCEERLAKRKEEHRQRELQRHLEEQERVVRRSCLVAFHAARLKAFSPQRQRLAEERQAAAKRACSPTPAAAGRGRGRGVSNLPAWMRQKQAGTDEQPPST